MLFYSGIVQLVEREAVNFQVAGSNPASRANYNLMIKDNEIYNFICNIHIITCFMQQARMFGMAL